MSRFILEIIPIPSFHNLHTIKRNGLLVDDYVWFYEFDKEMKWLYIFDHDHSGQDSAPKKGMLKQKLDISDCEIVVYEGK